MPLLDKVIESGRRFTGGEVPDILDDEDSDVLIDMNDYGARRTALFDSVRRNVEKAFPIANEQFELSVEGLEYTGPDHFTLDQRKQAVLEGGSLTRSLRGRFILKDVNTGEVVSKSNPRTLMNVPYLTDDGTYMRNGVDYVGLAQMRLVPNTYTRIRDDGAPETQFNIQQGTGSSFRIYMEPETSVFYILSGARKIPFVQVLEHMGEDLEPFREAWGDEVFRANMSQKRSTHAASWIKAAAERGKQIVEREAKDARLIPFTQPTGGNGLTLVRTALPNMVIGELEKSEETDEDGKPVYTLQGETLRSAGMRERDPNARAVEVEDRIYLQTLKPLGPGKAVVLA
jgi:DNA-directed RNA polymerase beta subunit